MKQLVFAVCFVVIGIVIAGLGLICIGFDFSALNSAQYTTKTYPVSGSFSDISAVGSVGDIRFVLSQDDTCKVVCQEQKKMSHRVSVQDDTLTISQIDDRKWYDHIGVFWGSTTIVVYLPQAEYQHLTVKNSTGDVQIPGDFTFQNASIQVSTGDISLSAGVTESLNLKSSTGSICLNAMPQANTISISGGTGDIRISDLACQSLAVSNTTGEVLLDNVISAESIGITCSTGDICLNACDAQTLELKTKTGDINGSFLTDKIFDAKTSTGDVFAPSADSGGQCKATTSTGDIHLTLPKNP